MVALDLIVSNKRYLNNKNSSFNSILNVSKSVYLYFYITKQINQMKKKILSLLLILSATSVFAADTTFVKETQIPILIDRQDNVLFNIRVEAKEGEVLNQLKLQLGNDVKHSDIRALKLYYAGTNALQHVGKNTFAPAQYISREVPGKTRAANPSYSILIDEQAKPSNKEVTFACDKALYPGENFFWVSLEMKPKASLLNTITAKITKVVVDNKKTVIDTQSNGKIHRLGVGVRHAGDDDAMAFRIPGMVTSNKGTLLGVYDIRYNNSADLQEYVEIGLSRSTDKGQTWEKMRSIMAFDTDGGLPKAQNGVGDPAILVDKKTGTIWVVAAWTHAMGNQRAWWSSHPGMDKYTTAQLVMTKSDDDGKTWSKPINITKQVKDPSWYFLLQGPGSGISMEDGTLVFPIQFIDATRVPNAGVMYSKDHGNSWKIHNYARTNTTEAQVAEVEPGVLMLNMRDNRGGSRAVATTKDLGKTWEKHPSSRSALQEPVCMASLIKVGAKENVTGKQIMLFSNPNTTKGRHSMTIKASLDGGLTWPKAYDVLLDEGGSWGYSSLSMIDSETVGIFYEGSTAHMVFQAVKLTDILK